MSCSKCKKKEMRELIEKESLKVEKWAIITLILFTVSALYGLYSLIVKLL
jgi:hypothetical protein